MSGHRPVVPVRGRRQTPADRVSLAREILSTYWRARGLMRRANLAQTLTQLRASPGTSATDRTAEEQRYAARRLGRAVMVVLAVLPTDRRCLVRSLTVTALLARRGIPGRLVLGVRPDSSEPFLAHAWVEHEGVPVTPDEGYNRLHAL